MAFKVKFWGVRGSIACPSSKYAIFGGNTSCIEVSCGGQRVILDCGTGIRNLGHWMLKKGVRQADILMSHTHWDHINGFPFFSPAYQPDHEFRIKAGHLFDIKENVKIGKGTYIEKAKQQPDKVKKVLDKIDLLSSLSSST